MTHLLAASPRPLRPPMSRRGRHGRHPHRRTRASRRASRDARAAADRRGATRVRRRGPRSQAVDTIAPPVGTASRRPSRPRRDAPARVPAPHGPAPMIPAEPRAERGARGRGRRSPSRRRRAVAARPATDGGARRPPDLHHRAAPPVHQEPAWVPMHELRRRFGIYGSDDDVSPMRIGDKTLFVGLPAAEAAIMAELLSGGDWATSCRWTRSRPSSSGVYPMRPVPRS